jgi:predicted nucleic acid-binding Zn ribbon protein
MDGMRELLRKELGRSLKALSELDRLQAAWAVACGKTMAEKGRVTGFNEGVVSVEADDSVWLCQMLSMRGVLEREMARIAEVKLGGIHFSLRRIAGSERE